MDQSRESSQRALRIVLIIIAVAALISIGWCVWYLVQYYRGALHGQEVQEIGVNGALTIDLSQKPEVVDLPIDFAPLQEMNPDVYAWITIPGTAVNYPVVHRKGDDSFYTHHSSDGAYYSGGSIYSEDYNGEQFRDPVTLLYGHNLRNGTMFQQLNDFSDFNVFSEHPNIYVFTQDRAFVYEIFAACPHSNEHLLANHDFRDREDYVKFFADVQETRAMSAQFRNEQFPVFENDDRVIVLSTCFRGNNQQRFLVMGRLLAEIPARYPDAGP